MKRYNVAIALIACLALVAEVSAQNKITTLILVRHAEKGQDGTNDPSLSEVGQKRANALAEFLSGTTVDAIYSTNYKRTKSTVEPLSKAKGVEVKLYEPFKEDSIDKILADNVGKTIVIVGHSNNIPWIANYVTGTKDSKDWKDNEYDNVWIVSVVEKAKNAQLTRLTFKINP